ncbi:hypothetical protein J3P85_03575 [Pseudomonas sp. Z1-12]|uniref:hypothetical protein n=1 Tax=Pseudomonas sp. Z1-12 TaxID=2817408 RepID=UPI003DA9D47E
MYKKFTGIVFLLLSGCSLHPYTKDELLNTGVTSPEYCLTQERAVVEERVQGYLNHCFHPQVTELTTGETRQYDPIESRQQCRQKRHGAMGTNDLRQPVLYERDRLGKEPRLQNHHDCRGLRLGIWTKFSEDPG